MVRQRTYSSNLVNQKSGVLMTGRKLGSHALVFDQVEVVELLRAAVDREGSQSAFCEAPPTGSRSPQHDS